jgi:hypothetical protein
VTDVEEIKTTVGKDNPFSFCLEIFDDPEKLSSCPDFAFHSLSFLFKYQI